MKLPFYTDTPGLERFPQHERFAIYRGTHKLLLKEDAAYRKRRDAFVVATICLAVSPACALTAKSMFAELLTITLALGTVPLIVWLAFRQQKYMNQQIGAALQNHS